MDKKNWEVYFVKPVENVYFTLFFNKAFVMITTALMPGHEVGICTVKRKKII